MSGHDSVTKNTPRNRPWTRSLTKSQQNSAVVDITPERTEVVVAEDPCKTELESLRQQLKDIEQSGYVNCSICYENMKENQPVSTSCGHLFCKQCIKTVVQTQQSCPVCKRSIIESEIKRIYF